MQAYDEQEINAVMTTLWDGWLAPGPRTAEFEHRIATRFGKKFGLFVNSGSSANLLAVICGGVCPGVEVVTPACTFATTVAPLVQQQANVRFCDVAPNRYNPSVDQILAELTPATKVCMIPNLLGNKIDWKSLRARLAELGRGDVVLIEDSCDTITTTVESDIATTSFYASHIITSGGAGGMVMFNSEGLYKRALQLRDWGRVGSNSEEFEERFNHDFIDGIQYDWKFLYCEFGYNFKACEMNAAFGLVQLTKLPRFEQIRHTLFSRYLANLKTDPDASRYFGFPEGDDDILWLAMPLACPHRIELLKTLEDANIQTRVTMAGNILRHPVYRTRFPEQAAKQYPVSDLVMRQGFLIGCHHGMNVDDVDRVCSVLIEFARTHLLVE
jgi:CDP-6-deoxy-D-xylo-4-hexulose-3-dehydrase